MNSHALAEYLRSGVVPPVTLGAGTEEILRRLGPPIGWGGGPGYNFGGVTAKHYSESKDWFYGDACVNFGSDGRVVGMELNYCGVEGQTYGFSPYFDGLPSTRFTVGVLLELLRSTLVRYEDHRHEVDAPYPILTEGHVVVYFWWRDGRWSDDNFVRHLEPLARAEPRHLLLEESRKGEA